MRKEKLESEIQREICDWLASLKSPKLIFWRSNNVPVFARSNDGKMRFRKLPKYTPQGLPDIMIVYRGLFYGLEVKRPHRGFLRNNQESWGRQLKQAGGLYFVVYSLQEAQNIILMREPDDNDEEVLGESLEKDKLIETIGVNDVNIPIHI
jgi:hypothetical protein